MSPRPLKSLTGPTHASRVWVRPKERGSGAPARLDGMRISRLSDRFQKKRNELLKRLEALDNDPRLRKEQGIDACLALSYYDPRLDEGRILLRLLAFLPYSVRRDKVEGLAGSNEANEHLARLWRLSLVAWVRPLLGAISDLALEREQLHVHL